MPDDSGASFPHDLASNLMMTAVLFAVFAGGPAILSWFGTRLALAYTNRGLLIDVPNERSSHVTPTSRSGGIGIMIGLVLASVLSAFIGTIDWSRTPLPAIAFAFGIGLWDDIRPMRPRVKFGLLVLAASLAAWMCRVATVRGLPICPEFDLAWASWPLTLFWLACYPNAFNFMDGLNGIAALTAVVSGTAFAIAGIAAHDWGLIGDATLTAGIALGFLPWNFPRARSFMGDAGSLVLGLMLAWCAVRANNSGALPFPASILLLGPFLFDVTFTLVRRKLEGKVIGAPHKEHLYQRLSRIWDSHAKVSLLYAGFAAVCGALALLYPGWTDVGKLVGLVLPLAGMGVFAALVLRSERAKGG